MLAHLNAAQAEAVAHCTGPLLVLAGAGSGKTRVITYRVANLLTHHRVAPYRILAVTFTNKAAGEMRSRLAGLVGEAITRDLWVGTFHAMCARLLRIHHDAVGLTSNFVIYDDTDQRALVARILKALRFDDRVYPPKKVLSWIHQHKQEGRAPTDISIGRSQDQAHVAVYESFEEHLRAANAVDFDDLILHVMRLAESTTNPVGTSLRGRFSHVLVDEFQDANPVQYRLVRALVRSHDNLCVVGDDDQSIYRWRGADVRIIRGFKMDFPQARVVRLEENYRSTGRIVRGALAVIRPSEEREPKNLFTSNPDGEVVHVVATRDEHDEAAYAVQQLQQAIAEKISPRDIAIFYRTHAQSRVLEEAMRAHNVPYQIVGGTRFFERAEIKDILAYLRAILNPQSDVDLLRIINVPARGIGQSTIDRVLDAANRQNISVYRVLSTALDTCELGPTPRNRIRAFLDLLAPLLESASVLSPRLLTERILEETGYHQALVDENTAEADARLENLGEFVSSLAEYEYETSEAGRPPTLAGYLERVTLVTDTDQMTDAPRVPMMTVHSAKGLEFSVVILTGMEEDLFPYRSSWHGRDDIEEERRLAYVALTRARHKLYVTHAGSRTIYGTTRYTRPSQFLGDLPDDVVEHVVSPAVLSSRPPTAPHRSRAGGALTGSDSPKSTNPDRSDRRRMPGERFVDPDPQDAVSVDEVFAAGCLVTHAQYGRGEVRRVDKASSPPIVVVYFPRIGEKRIIATFLRPRS